MDLAGAPHGMSHGVIPSGSGSSGTQIHTLSGSSGGVIVSSGAEGATDYTTSATSTRYGTTIQLSGNDGTVLIYELIHERSSGSGMRDHERSSVAHRRSHRRVHFAREPVLALLCQIYERVCGRIHPTVEAGHREQPPDRSSHISIIDIDHRKMGIRPIDLRLSQRTRCEADVFQRWHRKARARDTWRGRPGSSWDLHRPEDFRPSSELRSVALRIVRDYRWQDYGVHRWPAWAALYRVGYHNGIYCTLSFNRRWFQRFAFAIWRKLVFERRALIRACLANRGVPQRLVDDITGMVFPVRGTPLHIGC